MKQSNRVPYKKIIDSIQWNSKGLIPAIAQSVKDNQILMLAWVNKQALEQTITTLLATYFSRSRDKLWVKGEFSGHYQKIKKIRIDCDLDSVLFQVEQCGDIACHTNRENCFFYELKQEKKEGNSNKFFEIILPIKK